MNLSCLTAFTRHEYTPSMTASEIIDQLGGNRDVAAMFGVKSSAVSNWRALDRFPERLHYRLAKECANRGISLDDRFLAPGEAAD